MKLDAAGAPAPLHRRVSLFPSPLLPRNARSLDLIQQDLLEPIGHTRP